jgi:hypothetical protein
MKNLLCSGNRQTLSPHHDVPMQSRRIFFETSRISTWCGRQPVFPAPDGIHVLHLDFALRPDPATNSDFVQDPFKFPRASKGMIYKISPNGLYKIQNAILEVPTWFGLNGLDPRFSTRSVSSQRMSMYFMAVAIRPNNWSQLCKRDRTGRRNLLAQKMQPTKRINNALHDQTCKGRSKKIEYLVTWCC